MRRRAGYIALLAALAAALLILPIAQKREAAIGLKMRGWIVSTGLANTNPSATIEVTNRTMHTQAIGLTARVLNARGEWDPISEQLVFPPGIANVMFLLPGRSGTNVMVNWIPGRGRALRIQGEYQRVAGRQEGRLIRWMNKFRLVYPLLSGGQIPPEEIRTPPVGY